MKFYREVEVIGAHFIIREKMIKLLFMILLVRKIKVSKKI